MKKATITSLVAIMLLMVCSSVFAQSETFATADTERSLVLMLVSGQNGVLSNASGLTAEAQLKGLMLRESFSTNNSPFTVAVTVKNLKFSVGQGGQMKISFFFETQNGWIRREVVATNELEISLL